MLSTVTVTRLTTAQVVVEHPDEWEPEQVQKALVARVVDVVNGADMWMGENVVRLAEVAIDYDYREHEADEGDAPPMRPPVELTEADLEDAPPPKVITAEEAANKENADG